MPKINLLKKLNLTPNFIYETIVTTYNANDKTPNAAPMGIFFLDENQLIISPYNSTKTYRNLVNSGCGVINFIFDLEVFLETAFNNASPKLPAKFFENADQVDAPRLKDAVAYIEIRVLETQKGEDRSKIIGKVVTWEISTLTFHPINRGYNLALESIIHATRIVAFKEDSEKIKTLKNLIAKYQKIIEKVAPTGDFIKIMGRIQEIINK